MIEKAGKPQGLELRPDSFFLKKKLYRTQEHHDA